MSIKALYNKYYLNFFQRYDNIIYAEYVPVAQPDRVSDSDSEGRAFESHQAYHVGTSIACSDFCRI